MNPTPHKSGSTHGPRDALQIRLYEGDRDRVAAGATKAGMSVSDYVRKRLGLPRKRVVKREP